MFGKAHEAPRTSCYFNLSQPQASILCPSLALTSRGGQPLQDCVYTDGQYLSIESILLLRWWTSQFLLQLQMSSILNPFCNNGSHRLRSGQFLHI